MEQEIDANEDLDGKDENAIQVLAKSDGHYVGTGRMMLNGHIGRLAVLKDFRHKKIGSEIILTLINIAKNQKLQKVSLGAQCIAVNFYHKLGFTEYGNVFLDANIDHIMMKKAIDLL